jgi:hypothetical protein
MKNIRIALLFFLWPGVAAHAQVRTWVSPNGLDTNSCTREQPCRNFAAAITAVAAGGEVVALESAGYGPVTITKSVTIVAPGGVHAAIAPTAGSAITVSAADSDQVVLRNLYLNSQGADYGIDADAVAALYVESCIISGFDVNGIFFDPATSGARLYVSDTVVRRSGTVGIFVFGGTGIRATIDSARLHQNTYGIYIQNSEATIRQSVASGGNTGFYAESAKAMIEDGVSTGNATGFFADAGSAITMTRCAATSNSANGVRANGSGSTIYVSDSTITANQTGVSTASSGVVTSRGNNTLQANTTNGAFTSTFAPN